MAENRHFSSHLSMSLPTREVAQSFISSFSRPHFDERLRINLNDITL
jgi:hypothetical protein